MSATKWLGGKEKKKKKKPTLQVQCSQSCWILRFNNISTIESQKLYDLWNSGRQDQGGCTKDYLISQVIHYLCEIKRVWSWKQCKATECCQPGDKVSMLMQTCPHKPLRKIQTCNHQADSPLLCVAWCLIWWFASLEKVWPYMTPNGLTEARCP